MQLQFGFAKRLAKFSHLGGMAMIGLIASLAFASQGFTQSDENDSPVDIVAAKIAELDEKLVDEVNKLGRQHGEAETKEEREKIVQRRREIEKEIVDGIISQTQKRERANIVDLAQLLEKQVKGEARTTLIEHFQTHYKESESLDVYVRALGKIKTPTQEVEDAIKFIAENSSSKTVQAKTAMVLVDYLENVKTRIPRTRRKPNPSYLASRTKEEIDKEIDSTLENLVANYSEVKSGKQTFGQLASKKLQLRNIQIGKVAPDIEGVDLDDVSFKLSEYRGKVVVIDFWGDW